MQFLNPAVLFGLVAAAIPLAIHLLHRGRTRPLPFSNLLFLRRLHHSRLRRVRLRQWLVLLLRTLIIVLIICAFARPAYQAGAGWGGRSRPTAAVLFLDRSFSTGYRLPGGTLFAQLQRQAEELLGLFGPGDQLDIIPFDSQLYPFERAAGDERIQAEQIRGLTPGEAATDLTKLVAEATRLLDERPGANRELFLLTDLARYNWYDLDRAHASLPDTRIYISRLALPDRSNAHIDSVVSPSWLPAVGEKLDLQVALTNSGERKIEGAFLDLFVDGERIRHQEVDLRPGAQVGVELTFAPRRTGRLTGYVELEEDALTLDNRRYFTIDVPEKIDVLILGERPTDTYYPRRALNAALQTDPALEVRSGLLAELDREDLDGTDVLLLCNLQRLNSARTKQLHDFVAGGGGLILLPSPQADLNYFNRDLLPGLLPVSIKGRADHRGGGESYQSLEPNRPHHPLFHRLLTEQEGDRPRFYASFDLVPREGLRPLIHFTDGRLALVSGWRERGRSVLLATPLSLEWTDMPIRGLFAPLLHRLVRDLSLPVDRYTLYFVGERVYRYLDGVSVNSSVQAENPSGDRLLLEPELIGGQYRWKIPRVDESGIWKLWLEKREIDRFAVNVDTRESVLTPVSEERPLQLFGAENTYFLDPGGDLRLQVLGNRYGRELWREFIGLALLLLLLEQWIARAPRDAVTQNG